ncbi:MAG: alpha/beta hydrolase [Herpetosiphonaceae bacterium]|nr:alpha/beta hydrolase [Herpetosiphonaceae bacterium]
MHRPFLVLPLLSLTIGLAACGTTPATPQVAAQPTTVLTAVSSPTTAPLPTSMPTRTVVLPTPTVPPTLTAETTVATASSSTVPVTPTPGGFAKNIDVGGRTLHILCIGTGTPTVILDTGAGDTSDVWAAVQYRVGKATQVCVYDRANLGLSDPAPKPRTSQDMVKDLHTLLVNAHLAGPYVLVGHSIAGWNVRLFANQYPKEVAGIVLVDASHPDQGPRMVAAIPPPSPGESPDLTQYRQGWTAPSPINSPDNPEGQDFETSAVQVRASHSLGDIPLLVLTAGNHQQPPFITAAVAAKLEQAWQAMQHEQAGLSSNSIQIIAKDSDHCIHCDHPQIVSAAIQQVVDAAKHHTRLKTP